MFSTKIVQCFSITSQSIFNKNNVIQIAPMSAILLSKKFTSLKNESSSLNKIALPSINFVREYAKGKDKKKEKGKGKVEINENQISELVDIEALKTQMGKSVDHLKEDFIKHLSIRSAVGSIESLTVNVDGKQHTLQEIAQIVRKNPKTLIVNMAVFPQAIKPALKAIEKSGMNLNPQQDGTTLFIPIPPVTKDHREKLAKNAKSLFVKYKDTIREVQNKYVKQIKKKEGVSQDIARNVEQQIITIADAYIQQCDSIMNSKIKELLGKD